MIYNTYIINYTTNSNICDKKTRYSFTEQHMNIQTNKRLS